MRDDMAIRVHGGRVVRMVSMFGERGKSVGFLVE